MTSPIELMKVQCPACGVAYGASYRASFNAALGEHWTDEQMEEARTATCTECGHKVTFDQLRVDKDGMTWRVVAGCGA